MPIQVEHLTHTYMPGSPFSAVALNDVSLTIEDGELIGLLGHTGSGKTTLVQHLNGLIKPTSGRVVVDGLDLTQKGVSLLEVRKKVGLVFQYPEYQLFEETVAKDIAFGPRNMGLDAEEIDRRVRGAMLQVGLNYDEVAERSPFELSGGQMRRVAIAGVLAMRPRVHHGRADRRAGPRGTKQHSANDSGPAYSRRADGHHGQPQHGRHLHIGHASGGDEPGRAGDDRHAARGVHPAGKAALYRVGRASGGGAYPRTDCRGL